MGTREYCLGFPSPRPIGEVIAGIDGMIADLVGAKVRRLEQSVPGDNRDVYVEIRGDVVFLYGARFVVPLVDTGTGDVGPIYRALGMPPLLVAHIYNDSSWYVGYALFENGVKTRRWMLRGSAPRGPTFVEEGTPKDYEAAITDGVPLSDDQMAAYAAQNQHKLEQEGDPRIGVASKLHRTTMEKYLGTCTWWDWQKPDHDFRFRPTDRDPAHVGPVRPAGCRAGSKAGRSHPVHPALPQDTAVRPLLLFRRRPGAHRGTASLRCRKLCRGSGHPCCDECTHRTDCCARPLVDSEPTCKRATTSKLGWSSTR